jgi:hypothetical protein
MIDDNRIIQSQLPCPIKEKISIGAITIVRVDDDESHGSGDRTLNRNIYAFSHDGSLLWQIQEAPDGGDEWPKPYTSIKIDGDSVIVGNWVGTDYQLNLDNGTVRFYGSPRRPW